jgi:hypothetical protein
MNFPKPGGGNKFPSQAQDPSKQKIPKHEY